MPKDVINHAISLAKGKTSPMQYLNQVLSTWHSAEIKTLDEAKAYKSTPTTTAAAQKQDNKVMTRSYTTEELNSLFDNLDEVEI